MSNDIKESLIDKDKDSGDLHIELKGNIGVDEKKEEKKEEIKDIEDKPIDIPNDDKATLESMGFQKELIDKIYSVMHPENLDEALDYLNKNDKDKFTHSYIPNNTSNVCSICGYKRSDHDVGDIDDLISDKPLIEEKKEEKKEEGELLISKDLLDDNEEDKDIQDMLEKYRNKFRGRHFNIGYNGISNISRECGVCGDTIESADMNLIKLPCKHSFCLDCWKEYLKEKINNANVYKLACMQKECNYILEEKFIKSILDKDTVLLEKYDKFLTRKKLIDSNKKIKLCPFPDCDGYAEKKKFSKYVKCNKGHEFCFECLTAPHGSKACSKIIDAGFEEWKKHTMVKRCPNCKFWTEKNEGCNHMTCSQCNFQWCWICQKECVAGHYSFGPCKGLHFSKVSDDQDAKQLMKDNCDCCCVLGWIIMKFVYLVIYLFMMPCFYLAVLGFKYLDEYGEMCCAVVFFCLSFLPFFVCYEVLSVCYIVVLSIPGLFICPYNRFLQNVLFGKILGQLFPV